MKNGEEKKIRERNKGVNEESLRNSEIARLNRDRVDVMKVRETAARAGKGMTEGNDRTWRDPANYCHSG